MLQAAISIATWLTPRITLLTYATTHVTASRSIRLARIGVLALAALSVGADRDASARLINDGNQAPCSLLPNGRRVATQSLADLCNLRVEVFVNLSHLAQSQHHQGLVQLQQNLQHLLGLNNQARSRSVIDLLTELNKLDVPVEHRYDRFVTIATRHANLTTMLRDHPVTLMEAQDLREQAAAALEHETPGVDQARILLTTARNLLCSPAGDNDGADCATGPESTRLFRDLAWLEEGALNFPAAARWYEQAARTIASDARAGRMEYLASAARLWSDHGQVNPRSAGLERSLRIYQEMLGLISSDRTPDQWSTLQMSLAKALQLLGHRERDKDRLQRAVEAFQASLRVMGRHDLNRDQPFARGELATTLHLIGELGTDAEPYRHAVEVFREALKGARREHQPLLWAAIQNNLGATLWTLSKVSDDARLMADAATAFNESLSVWTRQQFPYDWALAQNNLGHLYREMGGRTADNDSLQLAVNAYRRSLEVVKRASQPSDWALTQHNLGLALWTLGRAVDQPDLIEKATSTVDQALEIFDPQTQTAKWVTAKSTLGLIHFDRALEQHSESLMETAIAELSSALPLTSDEVLPLKRALIQDVLGRGYWFLGINNQDIMRMNQAKAAFSNAREIRVEEANMAQYQEFYDESIRVIETMIAAMKGRR